MCCITLIFSGSPVLEAIFTKIVPTPDVVTSKISDLMESSQLKSKPVLEAIFPQIVPTPDVASSGSLLAKLLTFVGSFMAQTL